MASLRKRAKVWYYRFTDENGVKRSRKGCTDKRATEELAARPRRRLPRGRPV